MAYAWHGEPGKHDNVIPFFWLTRAKLNPAAAKAAADAMPKGHKVLFSWDLHNALARHPDDICRDSEGNPTRHRGIWWDHGVAQVAQGFDDFFRRYREIGGEVDALILDFEEGMSNWVLRQDADRYRAIMSDPRFELIAKQVGFRDLLTVMRWQAQTGEERERYRIWNALMMERTAAYVRAAIYEPVRKHFPSTKMSNWDKSYNAARYACPDRNGYEHSRYSLGVHVGTHQSSDLYAWLGGLRRVELVNGHGPYGAGPFEAFRHAVNRMRTMVLSTNVPAWPWISHKQFKESWIRNSDLYQELIFHAALSGADTFLYWNPRPHRANQKHDEYGDAVQDQLLSDCLQQLDEVVGDASRRSLIDNLTPWYGDYVLTGMSLRARTVWRFTPKLEPRQKREDIISCASPPGFQVKGLEISIAGGKLWQPTRELSNQGYWIIAPANAVPTIRRNLSTHIPTIPKADIPQDRLRH